MNPNVTKIDYVVTAANARIEEVAAEFERGAKNLHEALSRVEHGDYLNLPSKYYDIAMTVESIDGALPDAGLLNESASGLVKVVIGNEYVIRNGAGLNSGKRVKVISNMGIDPGRPVDWKNETVVQFDNGKIDIVPNRILEIFRKVGVMDDLEANFRSWEQGHDNKDDAEGLFATLMTRHPDEDESWLRKVAFDWVGYEEDEDLLESMMPYDYDIIRGWAGDDITKEEIDAVFAAYPGDIQSDLAELYRSIEHKRDTLPGEFDSVGPRDSEVWSHEMYNDIINDFVQDAIQSMDSVPAKAEEIMWAITTSYVGGETQFASGERVSESSETPVFTSQNAQDVANHINDALAEVAYHRVSISTLGGQDRPSLMLVVSLTPQAEWPNGIMENSNYFRMRIEHNGTMEVFTQSVYKGPISKENRVNIKFRRTKAKDINDAVQKLLMFIHKLQTELATATKSAVVPIEQPVKEPVVKESAYETSIKSAKKHFGIDNNKVAEGIDTTQLGAEEAEKLDDLLDDNFSMYDMADWEYLAGEIGVEVDDLIEYVHLNTRNKHALSDVKSMQEYDNEGPGIGAIHNAMWNENATHSQISKLDYFMMHKCKNRKVADAYEDDASNTLNDLDVDNWDDAVNADRYSVEGLISRWWDSAIENGLVLEHHLSTRAEKEKYLIDNTDLTEADVLGMTDADIDVAYYGAEANEAFNTSGFYQSIKKYLLPTTELEDIVVKDEDPDTSSKFIEIAIPYGVINTGIKHNDIIKVASKYPRYVAKQTKLDADRKQLRMFFINESSHEETYGINTPEDVEAFILGLAKEGKIYHFDDSARDIVMANGDSVFSEDEAELNDKKMARCFEVCEQIGGFWEGFIKDVFLEYVVFSASNKGQVYIVAGSGPDVRVADMVTYKSELDKMYDEEKGYDEVEVGRWFDSLPEA